MDVQQTALQGAADTLQQNPDFAARVKSKEWAERLPSAKNDPAAFLHPWAVLSAPDANASSEAFRKTCDAMAQRLKEQAERAKKESGAVTWLWGPESNGAERNWYVSGEAFDKDTPPVLTASRLTASRACQPLLNLHPASLTVRPNMAKKRPHRRGVLSAADSGQVSDKLQGALRSPTFTIEKPHLFYQLIGKDARVRLIIEGYQQIRDPLYGGLQFDVDSPDRATWRVQDVQRWIGHRAFIELADNGSGFLAVQRIGQGDGDPPVASPNPFVRQMLSDPGPDLSGQPGAAVRRPFKAGCAMADRRTARQQAGQ